jgi:hypothetical protein
VNTRAVVAKLSSLALSLVVLGCARSPPTNSTVAESQNSAARADFVHLPEVKFGELPSEIQGKIEGYWTTEGNCSKEPMTDETVYTLDANADFKTDFLWQPPCPAADGPLPAHLWVSKADGGFTETLVWNTSTILKSDNDFMFTVWCGGSHVDPAESLAVLDRDNPRIVAFGKCYASLDAAISEAKRRGYQVVGEGQ